jgi:hypothetical protein
MITNEQRIVRQLIELLSIMPEDTLQEGVWTLKAHLEREGTLPVQTPTGPENWRWERVLVRRFHDAQLVLAWILNQEISNHEETIERVRRILMCPGRILFHFYERIASTQGYGSGASCGYAFREGSWFGGTGDGRGCGTAFWDQESDGYGLPQGDGAGDGCGYTTFFTSKGPNVGTSFLSFGDGVP